MTVESFINEGKKVFQESCRQLPKRLLFAQAPMLYCWESKDVGSSSFRGRFLSSRNREIKTKRNQLLWRQGAVFATCELNYSYNQKKMAKLFGLCYTDESKAENKSFVVRLAIYRFL